MFSSLNVTPAELWQMLLTHLWLSGLALLAAVAIAVPAAVLLPAAGSGLLAANVLHINNIRDLSSDWAAGKHTLANKLGFSGSLKMHRALLLAGLVCYALYAVFAWQSVLWLLALPMILHHARHVAAARSEAEAGAELGAAVMLHFAVNALFAIGVLLT